MSTQYTALENELAEALANLLRNRDDAEALIRDMEGRPAFDDNGFALPCASPEAQTARALLNRLANP